MNRKWRCRLIQAAAAILLMGGVEALFYTFGVSPYRLGGTAFSSTAYQLLLALLYFLDVPILACVAGYRKWDGALFGYGVTVGLQLASMEILGAPFYGIALRFGSWKAALWILAVCNALLALGAYLFGRFLRRRGWGLSVPGEH